MVHNKYNILAFENYLDVALFGTQDFTLMTVHFCLIHVLEKSLVVVMFEENQLQTYNKVVPSMYASDGFAV